MAAPRRGTPWVPAVLCVGLLAVLTGGILLRARQICDGHFGYPIDDTYIHMAMAKNFATHGVWGVTRFAFSSSTSSPLFTLLLAGAYLAGGVHEITPLLINFVLAAGLIAWCCAQLAGAGFSQRATAATVAVVVVATPLYALTLVGMEHVLHTWLTLIFVHLACRVILAPARRAEAIALLAVTPLLVMARYEGTFLVLTAGLLLAARGRWGMFLGLGTCSSVPLTAYAAISVRYGWYALPTSLLLKANLPGQTSGGIREFGRSLATTALTAPHLPSLLLIAAGLLLLSWRKHGVIWNTAGLGLTMFVTAGALHMLFARVGWYFRYEAYLVAFGGMALAWALRDLGAAALWRDRRLMVALCAALLAITLGVRASRAIYFSPRGIRNIYDQQYQTARFIRQYYPHANVVVNDIGAVCFLSDARVLDPIGLGDIAPAKARLRGEYNAGWLEAWARENGATLAIAYPDIAPPADWPLLGKWTIPDRWVVGHADVNVYAVDPTAIPELRKNLSQFQAELPRGVHWTGL